MTNENDTGTDLSRRAVLGAVAASSAGLAGCFSSGCDAGIEKSTQSTFQYGSQGTYEIRIHNHADVFGTCSGDIVVEDQLPPGITFDSVSGNWTANVSGGVVTATNDSYGSLGPGGSITLELTVDVASASGFPVSPPVENCATATLGGNSVGIATPDDNCVTHTFSGQSPTPTATATESPTPTQTESPTPTRTESPTPTANETARPTPTDTQTPTATQTPTDTPTATPTDTPTATPTATPRDTPTQTKVNSTDSTTNRTS